MQRDAAGMRSQNSPRSSSFSHINNYNDYTTGDRPGGNGVDMAGFPVPSVIGEAMSNYVTMPSPDELWNAQPEKNSIRDFSTGNTRDNSDQFLNGVPFSGSIVNTLSASRYCPSENQVKLTTSNSLSYPFEHPKTTIANNSCNVVNSSFETMNHGYNESLVFGPNSTQWDFNNFMNPPELLRLMAERGVLNSNSHGSSRFSNELSLSLATSQRSVVNGTYIQEQRSGLSSSGYSSHKRQSESASCSSSNLSLSSNSHKPPQLFPVLSASRFFHAMQEILAEIASYALENYDEMSYNHSATGIDNGVDLSYTSSSKDGRANAATEREVEAKKKHLLDLLQMVDDQYNQCLDEIHTVISAFHAVTELDPNLHARFALPTISFMYKNLRERISSHILAMGATVHSNNAEEREDNSFEASFIQKQWALQQLKKRDQLWRPQRGLPERSVSVLRAWMFQNFLHPYPKDSEKHLLALKSGLTRSQVSNWFINARVRLWKPMIEEMYAEMNRRKIRGKDDKTDAIGNHRNLMRFENRRFTRDDMDDY